MVYDYTITVSSRFLPFLTRSYRIKAHTLEPVGPTTRLVLTRTDDTIICLPRAELRHVKLGRDYYDCRMKERDEVVALEQLKAESIARDAEISRSAVQRFIDSQIAAQRQAQQHQPEVAPPQQPRVPNSLAHIRAQQ
jgi:hypothetical protein